MLAHKLAGEAFTNLSNKQLVVDDYKVDHNKNQLTVVALDKVNQKFLKLVFSDFRMTEELFEIKGKVIADLYVHRHIKYFNSSYFIGANMTVVDKDQNNKDVFITIMGGGV